MDALKASLSTHGQYKPITVQAQTPEGEPRNLIVAGNHTWRGARELGWDEIAVSYIVCSDEDALRILLVDNRTNDLAAYDDPALLALLDELSKTELSFEGTGFSFDDFEDLSMIMAKGDTVNHGAGNTPQERTAEFERAGIRSIVLPYSIVQHERVVRALTELRRRWELDSFADVVLRLAEIEVPADVPL